MTYKCLSCSFEQPDTYRFCRQCGAPNPNVQSCPECGVEQVGGAFCCHCGRTLSGKPITEHQRQVIVTHAQQEQWRNTKGFFGLGCLTLCAIVVGFATFAGIAELIERRNPA